MTLSWGPYPTHPQLDDGTTLYLDLTEEGELAGYAHLLGEGVRHVRMPIRDHGVPSEEQLARTLDLLDEALGEGEVVYVHCRGGVGRTGIVIGCHRKRHGLEPVWQPETSEQCDLVRGWREGR